MVKITAPQKNIHGGLWGGMVPVQRSYELGAASEQPVSTGFALQVGPELGWTTVAAGDFTLYAGFGYANTYAKERSRVAMDRGKGAMIEMCVANCQGQGNPVVQEVAQHQDFRQTRELPKRSGAFVGTLGLRWTPPIQKLRLLAPDVSIYMNAGFASVHVSQRAQVGYTVTPAGAPISNDQLPKNKDGDWYLDLEAGNYSVLQPNFGLGLALGFPLLGHPPLSPIRLRMSLFGQASWVPAQPAVTSDYLQTFGQVSQLPPQIYNAYDRTWTGQAGFEGRTSLAWGMMLSGHFIFTKK